MTEEDPAVQRRAHVRRLLEVPASVTDSAGRDAPAHIVDIARMGVGFVTETPLPGPGLYRLRFCFPGQSVLDEAEIDVVYSREVGSEGRSRHGARFHDLTEECVARIVDYVTGGRWAE
jgi:hypothetical protein